MGDLLGYRVLVDGGRLSLLVVRSFRSPVGCFAGVLMKMKRIYIDFETYSAAPIELGAHAYVNHPSFRAVCLAYAVDNGPVFSTTDFSKIPAVIVQALKKPSMFIAHNAIFDTLVFEKTFRCIIRNFHDTAAVCRYLSIPASLDNAAGFFGLGQKLGQGKALIKKLSSGAELDAVETRELKRYAEQDMKLLRKLDVILAGKFTTDVFANAVETLHHAVNADGIKVDPERADLLLARIKFEKVKTAVEACALFGTYGKDEKPIASSADQVKKYLGRAGFHVESIAEKELEDWLSVNAVWLPTACKILIDCYRELQSRGADKLEKIVTHGLTRAYDSSLFHGSHTGRSTGGGINLFNVKRYGSGDDERPFEKSLRRIVKEAARGEKVKRLSSLLWGCLMPDRAAHVLVRSDLSAVEPRVGAWMRNDLATLDVYRNVDNGAGKDEYTIFGDAMGFKKAVSRNLSKIVILAACYGMSEERLRIQCRSFGVPDPGPKKAKEILDGYHRKNPSVKRAWFDLIKTAVRVISDGGIVESHGLTFFREKIHGALFLRVALPSGRIKSYADVWIETAGDKGWKTFSYIDPLKRFRTTMRTAMLYENMVQAVAVDIGFSKAFEIQKFAAVKLIIHDELNVSCAPGKAARVEKIMKAPVPWLQGMPVNAKTAVCSSFHKGDRI